jgi:hypothetical protein
MISNEEFHKRMKAVKVPEGFRMDLVIEERGWRNNPLSVRVYVITNDKVEVRFDQTGSGHTNWNMTENKHGQRTWSTFDRRGVEDSFYHLPLYDGDKTRYNVNKILTEQLRRVASSLIHEALAFPVPGIPGHTVSSEQLEKLQARLKKHGQISFHPSGFGTGYIITTKYVRGARTASVGTEKFFGVSPLFISTIEMD